jgi:hypothetical protein
MRSLLFFLTILVLFNCSTPENNPEDFREQVEAFADRIETDLANGKIGVLDIHFDKGVFVNRVINDAYWDEQLKLAGEEAYKADYKSNLMRSLSLAGLFLSGIDGSKYFSYDLSKIYRIEGRWHAIFRMYANEALNYHDMLLRVDSNKVWIEDVYIMAVGRQLSNIMQDGYISGIPSAYSAQRQRDNLLLYRSKMLMDQEQYPLALATFDSISVDYKKQKSLRLFRLQIGANIPNEAYVRDLERFEKDYPDDAGTLLFQIDKNFLYGNYPEVIKSLGKLQKIYGEDPVVDYLHANALNALGQCDNATPLYKQALDAKPDWQEPFFNWVECYIKSRDYKRAVALITEYTEAFSLTPTYVTYMFDKDPNLFLSGAYKTWASKFPKDIVEDVVDGPAL